MLGYSQGAQTMANALGGASAVWTPYPETGKNLVGLDQNVTKSIVGVALFGDPILAPNAGYRKGTADVNREGIFHRHDTTGLETVGDRLVSYWDAGDVFCDAGSDPSIPAHLHYVDDYSAEIFKFIVDKYENPGDTSGSPAPSASTSGATPEPSTQTSDASRLGIFKR